MTGEQAIELARLSAEGLGIRLGDYDGARFVADEVVWPADDVLRKPFWLVRFLTVDDHDEANEHQDGIESISSIMHVMADVDDATGEVRWREVM